MLQKRWLRSVKMKLRAIPHTKVKAPVASSPPAALQGLPGVAATQLGRAPGPCPSAAQQPSHCPCSAETDGPEGEFSLQSTEQCHPRNPSQLPQPGGQGLTGASSAANSTWARRHGHKRAEPAGFCPRGIVQPSSAPHEHLQPSYKLLENADRPFAAAAPAGALEWTC